MKHKSVELCEDFELTAYHKYLLKKADGDAKLLACLLFVDIVQDRNKQVFELLALTGDKSYTQSSFEKAGEILMNKSKNLK